MAAVSTVRIDEVQESLTFEDAVPGDVYRSATREVIEADIVRFASEWDPQPFHLDIEAARSSLFGALVASGLHTLVLSVRLFNDIGLLRTTALAGAGIERLRWLAPVHPGDVLHVRVEIAGKRSVKADGRGLVTVKLTTANATGRTVLALNLLILVARRQTAVIPRQE